MIGFRELSDEAWRQSICNIGLKWIGTPYRHQASVLGAGCDCLGLVRGVWREIYGDEPLSVPPYGPNWAEKNTSEILKQAADQCMTPIEISEVRFGDVILFRMKPSSAAKHIAILLEPEIILHAYWGRAVTKSLLSGFWVKRIAHAYAFPRP